MQRKLIAAGAGLLVYGALVGWAFTADYYDERGKLNRQAFRKIIREQNETIYELRAVEQAVKAEEAKLYDLNFEAEGETRIIKEVRLHSISLDNDGVFPVKVVDEEVDEGETEEETRSNLQALIDTYTADEEDVAQFVQSAGRTMERDYTPPFVISREKYAWDEDEGDDYSKITLTYYQKHRILLDDDEDPIEDINGMVGWKNLAQFGGESGDPEVVFIRNRHLLTDFEVVRDNENQPPIHIRYGMSRAEFETNKAAGIIRFRPGDQ